MKYAAADYVRFDPCEGDREGTLACRTVKLRTARTEHPCYFGICEDGHKIKPGDTYRDETALVDGSFWGRYRVCLPCMDLWLDGR